MDFSSLRTDEQYIGRVFGHLTVFSRNQDRARHWNCRCECGKEWPVRVDHLRSGRTTSCGCAKTKKLVAFNTKHGMCGTRVWRIWKAMQTRCHYEKYPEWHLYGGRGIQVCQRWRDSFEDFLADMGEPLPHQSIDRIDNNGNYEPGNCRWATWIEQAANRRPPTKRAAHVV